MGRLKAYDQDGKEVWIKDDYLDNYVEQELYRISKDDTEINYYFGEHVKRRTKALEDKILVLQGELDALKLTKEEKAEEALFIKNFVENYK